MFAAHTHSCIVTRGAFAQTNNSNKLKEREREIFLAFSDEYFKTKDTRKMLSQVKPEKKERKEKGRKKEEIL